MAAISTSRPAQRSQPSRKGKRAWRKNIDLDEMETGLDEVRDQEIVLGAGPLFEVDTVGDASAMTHAMRSEKKLRTYEILSQRSAVPALSAVHKKKDKPKSKVRKVHDLVRAAGRGGEDTNRVRVERDGLVRNTGSDLWGSEAPAAPKITAPRRAPEPVVKNAVAVTVAEEGRSYNPSQESWKKVIEAEHERAAKQEEQRQILEAEQARIQALMEEMENQDEQEELESESEDEVPADQIGKLSVNAPVKNKRKSQQKRNQMKRAREREIQQERLKTIKLHLKELDKLRKRAKTTTQLEQEVVETKPAKPSKIPRKAHGRHKVLEAPLAIKLSDEMEDSLRRLRPEGDLAKERFASLQARGLIEARVPVHHKRKNKLKSTEKWSYKDFTKSRGV